MATTTNYGWTTPDDTALVKDGAAAIRTLGSSIDTSLNTALGTKKAGMVLLNTTSFTAVASQSVNDVFSTTYDNYRIVCKISGGTDNDTIIRWRLRVSGSDDSNNQYYSASTYNAYNSTTFTNNNSFPSTSGHIPLISSNDGAGGGTFDVMSPFLSQKTTWGGLAFAKSVGISLVRGVFDTTTSFTGFTFFPSSNNISGSISIYGYNK